MERTVDLNIFACNAVTNYMDEVNKDREIAISFEAAAQTMLAMYEQMRRKAWAAETVLEHIMFAIDQHTRRLDTKTLPPVDTDPNYPFQLTMKLQEREIQPGEEGYEIGYQTHSA